MWLIRRHHAVNGGLFAVIGRSVNLLQLTDDDAMLRVAADRARGSESVRSRPSSQQAPLLRTEISLSMRLIMRPVGARWMMTMTRMTPRWCQLRREDRGTAGHHVEYPRRSSSTSAVCATRPADAPSHASPILCSEIALDSTGSTTRRETNTSSIVTDRASTPSFTTIRAQGDCDGR